MSNLSIKCSGVSIFGSEMMTIGIIIKGFLFKNGNDQQLPVKLIKE